MPDLVDRLNAALAGRYVIQRELGRGGMATVFLARDLKHPRSVAIKVLDPELAAAIGSERFLREIETAAGMNHPHILPLYDSGSAAGLLYYVMPYVEGESLRGRLERERQLPIRDALRLAGQVASALDYAHRRGVIHRDIKPENILLADGQAVVADFGIARPTVATGAPKLTATGVTVGTAMYMSPEQVVGSLAMDGRSDQYSLACVLYEMLSGQPPFTGPVEGLAHQHLNVAPRPVSALRTTVPSAVDQALGTALAKAPADRFGTTAEFATALATMEPVAAPPAVAPIEPPGTEGPVSRPTPPLWRRPVLAATAVTIAVLGFVSWQFGPCRPTAAAKRAWMLVAEFQGPAADSSVTAATRDLMVAALEQSEVVAVVPTDQVRVALQMAGRPASTRVDAELARELAYRSSVRTVLEGRIGRLGSGYSVVLRVVDVERDSVVLTVSDVAASEKALIPTIERVTRRIREGLGERRDAIQSSRTLSELRTPSLEAFKDVERGQQLLVNGDSYGAIAQARTAIALDPDFAMAWALMGYAFSNVGQRDSAAVAWRHALSLPERLGDGPRLVIEASVAELEGNLPLALATLDRLVQQEPTLVGGHANRGWLLYRTGQYEPALGALARGVEASPFGPIQILLLNRFVTLLALGRLDEARVTARELRGEFAEGAAVWMAAASGDWTLTDSLGAALEASPTGTREMRRLGALAVAAAAAARGQVRAAEEALRRAEGWVGAASIPAARVTVEGAHRAHLLLGLVSGKATIHRDVATQRDTTTAALVTHGLWAAMGGDTLRARRILDEVRSRPASDLAGAGADPALLEGWIAAQGGRWEETIRVLGAAAREGSEVGFPEDRAGRVTLRWLVADAYEALGRPDSAAHYLETLVSPLGRVDQEYFTRGIAFPFAHCRLVLLYARMGRIDDARRHWQMLSQTVRTPDPEVELLIEKARVALASAEGMARSERR